MCCICLTHNGSDEFEEDIVLQRAQGECPLRRSEEASAGSLFLVLPCPGWSFSVAWATERFGQGQLKLASAYQGSGPGGGLGELFR
jgi:hypothetical protein